MRKLILPVTLYTLALIFQDMFRNDFTLALSLLMVIFGLAYSVINMIKYNTGITKSIVDCILSITLAISFAYLIEFIIYTVKGIDIQDMSNGWFMIGVAYLVIPCIIYQVMYIIIHLIVNRKRNNKKCQ